MGKKGRKRKVGGGGKRGGGREKGRNALLTLRREASTFNTTLLT